MNKFTTGLVLAALLGAAVYFLRPNPQDPNTNASETGSAIVAVTLPEQLSTVAQIGKTAFEAKCAACHGINAVGQQGVAPPLVHKIYEPSHHGDAAFLRAAQNGVNSHHWPFGNMPPVTGLTTADTKGIIAYIRELQKANGIH
ncbi:MAG: cytochrome C [Rhodobacteraceae bacterium]|nr:MAG: cytochrome C [Paracoccaceae bacterium]